MQLWIYLFCLKARSHRASSVEVRVLCRGVRGGEVVSDWSKMQDGGWKAVF